VTALTTRVGDAEADITSEQVARTDADSALSSRIDTVSATLQNDHLTKAVIESRYLTQAEVDSAVSSLETTVNAAIGDVSADVSDLSTAFATSDGKVRAFKGMRATTTGSGSDKRVASISLTSYSDPDGTGSSTIQLDAENTIVNGTLSADKLVVGLGGNMINNADLSQGFAGWGGLEGTDISQRLRPEGTTYSGQSFPVLEVRWNGANTTEHAADVRTTRVKSDTRSGGYASIPCQPNAWYCASAFLFTLRCSAIIRIHWYDEDGNYLSADQGPTFNAGGGNTKRPDSWNREFIIKQSPDYASYCSVRYIITDTTGGSADSSYLFVHKPSLTESTKYATAAAPYTNGVTTLIDGNGIFSDAITADHIVANTITASEIASDSIIARHIKANEIDASHIKANEIDASHIKSNSIGAGQITANSIRASELAANSITASGGHIANATVDTLQIKGNAVTSTSAALMASQHHLPSDGDWTTLVSIFLDGDESYNTHVLITATYASGYNVGYGPFRSLQFRLRHKSITHGYYPMSDNPRSSSDNSSDYISPNERVYRVDEGTFTSSIIITNPGNNNGYYLQAKNEGYHRYVDEANIRVQQVKR
jgi:hypothetical protein